MNQPIKMLIAGVGGQGVVYLTDLITEAALLAGIPVASSEIHGLAQRRGSIVSGITFGKETYGYIEEAGADYLIGLEPLEAVRCLPFLNRNSRAIIDNNRILPHSVNAGKSTYPDIDSMIVYLRKNIRQVMFNLEFSRELPPVLRNIYILGRATLLEGFPVPYSFIEESIGMRARPAYKQESVTAFQLSRMSKEQGDHAVD